MIPRAPAARQRSASAKRIVEGVEAAEGNQTALAFACPREHAIVGHAVGGAALGVVQREHTGASCASLVELREQLRERQRAPILVEPEVGVRVEHLGAGGQQPPRFGRRTVRARRRRAGHPWPAPYWVYVVRQLHPVLVQRPFDLAVDGFEHVHPRVVLGLGGDDVPAGVLGVGALEHLLQRLHVELALAAVAPVVGGELPALERVVGARFEALELLVA